MDSSGPPSEAARARLQADYALDGWFISRRGALFEAFWTTHPGTPLVLRDVNVPGLRQRIETCMRVFDETHDRAAAEAAAKALET